MLSLIEMEIHIAKFLERFKSVGMAESILKDEVVKAVREIARTDITKKDIEFRNGDLIIQGSAFLKSELYMKKAALMARLDQTFLNQKIQNIR